MYRPMWPFLLMYGSHDMRHIGFRRLTVVNGPPKIGASHKINCFGAKRDPNKKWTHGTMWVKSLRLKIRLENHIFGRK